MTTAFAKGACRWFADLEANNSKAWFDENRAFWEAGAKAPLTAIVEAAAARSGGKPKVFRQNRDVRFSKDKSPYKTNTYGVVTPKTGAAAIYASIGKDGFYAGGGYYDMAKDQLERFREAIAGPYGAALADEVAALRSEGLEVWGRALKTAPRGYPKENERIELLRMKEIVAGARLDPKATESGEAEAHAARIWSRLHAFFAWLDQHVGPCRIPPEEMFARR
ncbi:MAG: DUF2461 domain-containing protein [Pseudomonadota bacterium]